MTIQTAPPLRFHSVSSQPWIKPLSPQSGQCQTMCPDARSSSAMMSPRHRRRPGLRRQGTFVCSSSSGRVVRDPGHDSAEEDGQTQDTFRHGLGDVAGLFVDVMPHAHDPAGWFHHALASMAKKLTVPRPSC